MGEKGQHSEGPWEYCHRGQHIWQTAHKGDGYMIAQVRGWGFLTGGASVGKVSDDEAIATQDANGRLIAAAPGLLKALERDCEVCASINQPNNVECEHCHKRKAIAKARGATS